MKFLNVYSEYIKNSSIGSIKENISIEADENKSKILKHLKNGKTIAAIAGIPKDVFTGERINGKSVLLTDGIYEWSSDIIYYYEKYNLKLPTEFLKSISI